MNDSMRRGFLKASLASLATAAVGPSVLAQPMPEEELQTLRAKTKAVCSGGKLEGYKRKEFGSRFHFRQHEESPGR